MVKIRFSESVEDFERCLARALQPSRRESSAVKNGDRPIRNPFVILREEFDDWAVLFDPDTGSGFGLNPIGVHLWKLFDGQHTIDTLLEVVQSQAENVPEEAREHIREIREFVDALAREGLVGLTVTSIVPFVIGIARHTNRNKFPATLLARVRGKTVQV